MKGLLLVFSTLYHGSFFPSIIPDSNVDVVLTGFRCVAHQRTLNVTVICRSGITAQIKRASLTSC